jgi:hypothetical protein
VRTPPAGRRAQLTAGLTPRTTWPVCGLLAEAPPRSGRCCSSKIPEGRRSAAAPTPPPDWCSTPPAGPVKRTKIRGRRNRPGTPRKDRCFPARAFHSGQGTDGCPACPARNVTVRIRKVREARAIAASQGASGRRRLAGLPVDGVVVQAAQQVVVPRRPSRRCGSPPPRGSGLRSGIFGWDAILRGGFTNQDAWSPSYSRPASPWTSRAPPTS